MRLRICDTQQTFLTCPFWTWLFHYYFCVLFVCIPPSTYVVKRIFLFYKFSHSISYSSINRKHQEFAVGTTENAGTAESYKLDKNRTTCFVVPLQRKHEVALRNFCQLVHLPLSQQLFTPRVANAEHQQEFLNKKQKNPRCADEAKVGTKGNSSFVAGGGVFSKFLS